MPIALSILIVFIVPIAVSIVMRAVEKSSGTASASDFDRLFRQEAKVLSGYVDQKLVEVKDNAIDLDIAVKKANHLSKTLESEMSKISPKIESYKDYEAAIFQYQEQVNSLEDAYLEIMNKVDSILKERHNIDKTYKRISDVKGKILDVENNVASVQERVINAYNQKFEDFEGQLYERFDKLTENIALRDKNYSEIANQERAKINQIVADFREQVAEKEKMFDEHLSSLTERVSKENISNITDMFENARNELVGQYKDFADNLNAQSKELEARYESVSISKEEFEQELYSIKNSIHEKLASITEDSISSFKEEMDKTKEAILATVMEDIEKIGQERDDVLSNLDEKANTISSSIDGMRNITTSLEESYVEKAQEIMEGFNDIKDGMRATTESLEQSIAEKEQGLREHFDNVKEEVSKSLKDDVAALADTLRDSLENEEDGIITLYKQKTKEFEDINSEMNSIAEQAKATLRDRIAEIEKDVVEFRDSIINSNEAELNNVLENAKDTVGKHLDMFETSVKDKNEAISEEYKKRIGEFATYIEYVKDQLDEINTTINEDYPSFKERILALDTEFNDMFEVIKEKEAGMNEKLEKIDSYSENIEAYAEERVSEIDDATTGAQSNIAAVEQQSLAIIEDEAGVVKDKMQTLLDNIEEKRGEINEVANEAKSAVAELEADSLAAIEDEAGVVKEKMRSLLNDIDEKKGEIENMTGDVQSTIAEAEAQSLAAIEDEAGVVKDKMQMLFNDIEEKRGEVSSLIEYKISDFDNVANEGKEHIAERTNEFDDVVSSSLDNFKTRAEDSLASVENRAGDILNTMNDHALVVESEIDKNNKNITDKTAEYLNWVETNKLEMEQYFNSQRSIFDNMGEEFFVKLEKDVFEKITELRSLVDSSIERYHDEISEIESVRAESVSDILGQYTGMADTIKKEHADLLEALNADFANKMDVMNKVSDEVKDKCDTLDDSLKHTYDEAYSKILEATAAIGVEREQSKEYIDEVFDSLIRRIDDDIMNLSLENRNALASLSDELKENNRADIEELVSSLKRDFADIVGTLEEKKNEHESKVVELEEEYNGILSNIREKEEVLERMAAQETNNYAQELKEFINTVNGNIADLEQSFVNKDELLDNLVNLENRFSEICENQKEHNENLYNQFEEDKGKILEHIENVREEISNDIQNIAHGASDTKNEIMAELEGQKEQTQNLYNKLEEDKGNILGHIENVRGEISNDIQNIEHGASDTRNEIMAELEGQKEQTQNLYNKLEEDKGNILGHIENVREEISSDIMNIELDTTEVKREIMGDIEAQNANLQEQNREALNADIKNKLEHFVEEYNLEKLNGNLDNGISENMSALIESTRNTLDTQLINVKRTLEDLDGRVENIEYNRIFRLNEDLNETKNNLNQKVKEHQDSIEDILKEIATLIKSKDYFATEIDDLKREKNELFDRYNAGESNLKYAIEDLEQKIDEMTSSAQSYIEEKEQSITDILSEFENNALGREEFDELTTKHNELVESVEQTMAEQEQLSENIATLGSKVDEMGELKDQVAGLNDLGSKVGEIDELKDQVAGLNDLGSKVDELGGLKEQVAGLSDLGSKVDELSTLNDNLSTLENKVEELGTLGQKLEGLNELEQKVDGLGLLEQRVEDLSDSLSADKEYYENRINDVDEKLSESLSAMREDFSYITDKLADIENNYGSQVAQIEVLANEISSNILPRVDSLENTLEDVKGEYNVSIANIVENIQNDLSSFDDKMLELENAIKDGSHVDDALASVSEESSALLSRLEELENRLTGSIDELLESNENINNDLEKAKVDFAELSDSIEQDARSLKEEILSELNFDEKFDSISESTKELLDNGFNELSEKMSVLESSVEDIVEDKVPSLSDRIDGVDSSAKTFEEDIREKVNALADEVRDIASMKEQVSSDIDDLVKSREELLSRIEENESNNNNGDDDKKDEDIASDIAKVEEQLRTLIADSRSYFEDKVGVLQGNIDVLEGEFNNKLQATENLYNDLAGEYESSKEYAEEMFNSLIKRLDDDIVNVSLDNKNILNALTDEFREDNKKELDNVVEAIRKDFTDIVASLEDKKSEHENKIGEIENQYNDIVADIKDKEEKYEALVNQEKQDYTEDLREFADAIKENISNLEETLVNKDELLEKLADLEAKFNEICDQQQEHTQSIADQFEDDKGNILDSIESLREELANDISNMEVDSEEIKEDVKKDITADFEKQHEDFATEIKNKLDNFMSEYDLEKLNANSESGVSDDVSTLIDNARETLETQIANVKRSLEDVDGRIENIEYNRIFRLSEDLNDAKNNLNQKIKEHQDSIAEIMQEIKTLVKSKDYFTTEIEELKKEKESLADQYSLGDTNLKDSIADIEQKIEEMTNGAQSYIEEKEQSILDAIAEFEQNVLTRDEFEKNALTKDEFEKNALTKDEFEKNALTKDEFEKTALTKDEFEKNALTKDEFEKTALTKNEFEKLSEGLTAKYQEIADSVEADRLVQNDLGDSLEALKSSVEDNESLVGELSQKIEDLNTTLASDKEYYENRLNDADDRLTDGLSNLEYNLSSITEKLEELENNYGQQVEQAGNFVNEVNSNILPKVEALENALEEAKSEYNVSIGNIVENLQNDLSTFDERMLELESGMKDGSLIDDVLASVKDDSSSALLRLDELENRLNSSLDDLLESNENVNIEFEKTRADFSDLSDTIEQDLKLLKDDILLELDIDNKLTAANNGMKEMLDGGLNGLTDNLNNLSEKMSLLEEALEDIREDKVLSLSDRIADVATNVKTFEDDVRAKVSTFADELKNVVDAKDKMIAEIESLSKSRDELLSKAGDNSSDEKLASDISNVEEKLRALIDESKNYFEGKVGELAGSLDVLEGEFNNKIQATESLYNDLAASEQEKAKAYVDEQIEKEKSELLDNIENLREEFTNDLSNIELDPTDLKAEMKHEIMAEILEQNAAFETDVKKQLDDFAAEYDLEKLNANLESGVSENVNTLVENAKEAFETQLANLKRTLEDVDGRIENIEYNRIFRLSEDLNEAKSSLNQKLKEQQDSVAEIAKELKTLEKSKDYFTTEIDQLKKDKDDLLAKYNAGETNLKDSIASVEQKIEDMTRSAQNYIEDKEQSIANTIAEFEKNVLGKDEFAKLSEDLTAKYQEVSDSIEQNRAENSRLASELKDELTSGLKAEHDVLRDEIKAEHDTLRTELSGSLEALKSSVENGENVAEQLAQKIDDLNGALASDKDYYEARLNDIDDRLADSVSSLEDSLSVISEKISELDKNYSTQLSQASEFVNELNSNMLPKVNSLESALQEAKTEYDAGIANIVENIRNDLYTFETRVAELEDSMKDGSLVDEALSTVKDESAAALLRLEDLENKINDSIESLLESNENINIEFEKTRADFNDLSDSIEQDIKLLKDDILSDIDIGEQLDTVSESAKDMLDSGLNNLSEKIALLEASLEDIRDDKVLSLSDRITDVDAGVKAFESNIKDKVNSLVDSVNNINGAKEKMADDIEQLLKSREEILSRVNDNSSDERLASSISDIDEQVRSLIAENKTYFENKVGELENSIEVLEDEFNNKIQATESLFNDLATEHESSKEYAEEMFNSLIKRLEDDIANVSLENRSVLNGLSDELRDSSKAEFDKNRAELESVISSMRSDFADIVGGLEDKKSEHESKVLDIEKQYSDIVANIKGKEEQYEALVAQEKTSYTEDLKSFADSIKDNLANLEQSLVNKDELLEQLADLEGKFDEICKEQQEYSESIYNQFEDDKGKILENIQNVRDELSNDIANFEIDTDGVKKEIISDLVEQNTSFESEIQSKLEQFASEYNMEKLNANLESSVSDSMNTLVDNVQIALETQIANVKRTLEEVDGRIENIEYNRIFRLSEDLNEAKSALSQKIKENHDSIENIVKEIATLIKSKDYFTTEIEELKKEKDDLFAKYNAGDTNLKDGIIAIEQKIEEMTSSAQNYIEEKEQSISDAIAEFEESVLSKAEFEKIAEGLTSQYQEAVDKSEADKALLDSSIDTLGEKVQGLSALEQKVDNLGSLEAKVNELGSLEQKVNNLSSLEEKVNELGSLKQEVSDLSTLGEKVDKLTALDQKLEDLNTTLSWDKEYYEGRLNDTDEKLADGLNGIREDFSFIADKITELENNYNAHLEQTNNFANEVDSNIVPKLYDLEHALESNRSEYNAQVDGIVESLQNDLSSFASRMLELESAIKDGGEVHDVLTNVREQSSSTFSRLEELENKLNASVEDLLETTDSINLELEKTKADFNDLSDGVDQDLKLIKADILGELDLDDKLDNVSKNTRAALDSGLINLSDKIVSLEAELKHIEEEKVSSLSNRIDNVDTSVKSFEDEMKEKIGLLTDDIKDLDIMKDKMSSDIEYLLKSREEILNRVADSSSDGDISEVEGQIRGLIEDSKKYFEHKVDQLENSLKVLEEGVAEKIEASENLYDELATEQENAREYTEEMFENIIKRLDDELANISLENKNFADNISSINSTNEEQQNANTANAAKLQELQSFIDTIKENISTLEASSANSVNKDELIDKLAEFETKFNDIREQQAQHAEGIAKQLEDDKKVMLENIANMREEISSDILNIEVDTDDVKKEIMGELVEQNTALLEERQGAFEASIKDRLNDFVSEYNLDKLNANLEYAESEAMNALIDNAKSTLETQISSIKKALEDVDARIENIEYERLFKLSNDLDEAKKALDEKIQAQESGLENLAGQLSNDLGEAKKAFDDKLQSQQSSLENLADQINQLHEDKELLLQKCNAGDTNLKSSIDDVEKKFEEIYVKLYEDKEYYEGKFADSDEKLSGSLASVHDNFSIITSKLEEIERNYASQLEHAEKFINDINSNMLPKVYSLEEVIDETKEQYNQYIDNIVDNLQNDFRSFEDRMLELEKSLKEGLDIGSILPSVQEQASSAVSRLTDLEDRLNSSVQELLANNESINMEFEKARGDFDNLANAIAQENAMLKDNIMSEINLDGHLNSVYSNTKEIVDNGLNELHEKVVSLESSLEDIKEEKVLALSDRIDEVDASLRAFEDEIKDKVGIIADDVDDITAAKERMSAEIEDLLRKRADVVNDSKETLDAGTLSTSVEAINNEIRRAVNDTRSYLENKISNLEDAVKVFEGGINNKLETADKLYYDMASENKNSKEYVEEMFNSLIKRLDDDIMNVSLENKNILGNFSEEMLDSSREKLAELQASMDEMKANISTLDNTFVNKDELLDKLSDLETKFDDVREQGKNIAEQLEQHKGNILENIEGVREEISNDILNIETDIQDIKNDVMTEFENRNSTFEAEVRSKLDSIISEYNLDKLDERLENSANESMAADANASIENAKNTLEAQIINIKKTLEDVDSRIENIEYNRIFPLSEELKEAKNSLEQQLQQHQESLSNVVNEVRSLRDERDSLLEKYNAGETSVKDSIDAIEQKLEDVNAKLLSDKEYYEGRLNDSDDKIIENISNVSENISNMIDKLEQLENSYDTLLPKLEQVEDNYNTLLPKVESLESIVEDTKQKYDGYIDSIVENFKSELSAVASKVDNVESSIQDGVVGSDEVLNNALSRLNDLEGSLNSSVSELRENSEKLGREFEQSRVEFNNLSNSIGQDTIALKEDVLFKLDSNLELDGSVSHLADKITAMEYALRDMKDGQVAYLSDKIEHIGENVAGFEDGVHTLIENSRNYFEDRINNLGNELSSKIENTSRMCSELTSNQEKVSSIIDNLDSIIVAKIEGMKENGLLTDYSVEELVKMREEVGSILENVKEHSRVYDDAIIEHSDKITSIITSLDNSATDTARAIEDAIVGEREYYINEIQIIVDRYKELQDKMENVGGISEGDMSQIREALDSIEHSLKGSVDNLDTRINDVYGNLDQLRDRSNEDLENIREQMLEGLASKIDASEALNQNIELDFDSIKANITEHVKSIVSTTLDDSSLVEKIDTISGQYESLQGDHDSLRGEYQTLQGDHNVLKGEHDNLVGEHQSLQGEHDNLKGEHDNLQGEHDSLIENLKIEKEQEHSALRDEMKKLSNEAMKSFDEISQSLDEKIYDIYNNINKEQNEKFDEILGSMSETKKELSDFETEVQNQISNAKNDMLNIEKNLNQRIDDKALTLQENIDALYGRMSAMSDEVGNSINEKERALLEKIDSIQDIIRGSLDLEMSNLKPYILEMIEKYVKDKTDLSSKIDDVEKNIKNIESTFLEGLERSIAVAQEKVELNLDIIEKKFSIHEEDLLARFKDEFDAHSDKSFEQTKELFAQVEGEYETRIASLNDVLAGMRSTLENAIDDAKTELSTTFDLKDDFIFSLKDNQKQLADLESNLRALESSFEPTVAKIESTIDSRINNLYERIDDTNERLLRKEDDFKQKLDSLVSDFSDIRDTKTEEIDSILSNARETEKQLVDTINERINSILDEKSGDLDSLRNNYQAIFDNLGSLKETLTESINNKIDEANLIVDERTSMIASGFDAKYRESVDSLSNNLNDTINTLIEDARHSVTSARASLEKEQSDRLGEFRYESDNIRDLIDNLAKDLARENAEYDIRFDKLGHIFDEKEVELLERFRVAAENMQDTVKAITDSFDSSIQTARDDFDTTVQTVREDFDSNVKNVRDDFDTTIKTARDDFDTTVQTVRGDFDSNVKNVRDDFDTTIKTARDDFDTTVHTVKEDFHNTIQTSREDFNSSIEEKQADVDIKYQSLKDLHDVLELKVANYLSELDNIKQCDALTEAIENNVNNLNDMLLKTNEQRESLEATVSEFDTLRGMQSDIVNYTRELEKEREMLKETEEYMNVITALHKDVHDKVESVLVEKENVSSIEEAVIRVLDFADQLEGKLHDISDKDSNLTMILTRIASSETETEEVEKRVVEIKASLISLDENREHLIEKIRKIESDTALLTKNDKKIQTLISKLEQFDLMIEELSAQREEMIRIKNVYAEQEYKVEDNLKRADEAIQVLNNLLTDADKYIFDDGSDITGDDTPKKAKRSKKSTKVESDQYMGVDSKKTKLVIDLYNAGWSYENIVRHTSFKQEEVETIIIRWKEKQSRI